VRRAFAECIKASSGDRGFDRTDSPQVSWNRLMNPPIDRKRSSRNSSRVVAPIMLFPEQQASSVSPAVAASGKSLGTFSQFFQRKAPSGIHRAIAVTMILASGFLLFFRLGNHALWDDEANTALIGEGVWRTGDTSAVMGHNIMGYRDGGLLAGLKERYDPPLQFFLDAPMVGLFPRSALAVRIPFAVAGLLSVALVFWWLRREEATLLVHLLAAMGFLGNVSFWLYCRQGRYYSVATLLSIAIAFLYLSPTRKRWTVPAIAVCSVLLFATHYLVYAAVYGALGVDWLIWGRRRFRLGLLDLLWLWIPQLICNSVILWIWDPLGKTVFTPGSGGIYDRLILFWWAWRDVNRCEFGVELLILASPIVWLFRRDLLLLRGPLALLVYILVTEILSPQKGWIHVAGKWEQLASTADVRYLAAAIPLMIALGVLAIARAVPRRGWWLALPLGAVAFGTNALQGGRLLKTDTLERPQPWVQSTLGFYIEELVDPPPDPYTPVAAWIEANVPDGASVLVYPDFMTYPLMFHAPNVIYAWQLPYPAAKQFAGLPAIQFRGQALPDYLICFGPVSSLVFRSPIFPVGTQASLVATIDAYWRPLYRPELFWRVFKPVKDFDHDTDAIHIWHLCGPSESDFHL
jgi:hypothetical protein